MLSHTIKIWLALRCLLLLDLYISMRGNITWILPLSPCLGNGGSLISTLLLEIRFSSVSCFSSMILVKVTDYFDVWHFFKLLQCMAFHPMV